MKNNHSITMKMTFKFIGLLFLLTVGPYLFGQTKKDKALENAKQAIALEDEGQLDEAIKLLQESEKLDPGNIIYPYELAYAYYAKAEYKQACKKLESIYDHKDASDRVFQLLGNCYDNLGKSEKAIETYSAGLEKFPESGNLNLEMGIMYLGKEDYDKAIDYFETGIKVAPQFSSNYYWAAKLYCGSTEEVWGMIYGELFMNIERNSKRTEEISKILFDTYKREILFSSDTSFSVSFSQNAVLNVNDLKNPNNLKLPFGVGTYEPTLMLSMINEKTININSLDRIRKNFVEAYFKNGKDKDFPNILFDYQNMINKAGHMEAYNHWILMKGDEEGFEKWELANPQKWDDFVNWFGENNINISKSNMFYREQY